MGRPKGSSNKKSKHEANQALLKVVADKKREAREAREDYVPEEVEKSVEMRDRYVCRCGFNVVVEGDTSNIKKDKDGKKLCSKCSGMFKEYTE